MTFGVLKMKVPGPCLRLTKAEFLKWGPGISIFSNSLGGSNANGSVRSTLSPSVSTRTLLGQETFHALA